MRLAGSCGLLTKRQCDAAILPPIPDAEKITPEPLSLFVPDWQSAGLAVALLLAGLLAGCLSPHAAAPAPDASLAATVTRPAIRFETEAGGLTVLLYPDAAPKTVALMEQYVKEGYYVGRSFGRTAMK